MHFVAINIQILYSDKMIKSKMKNWQLINNFLGEFFINFFDISVRLQNFDCLLKRFAGIYYRK